MSGDTSAGIVTGHRLDDQGIEVDFLCRRFSLLNRIHTVCEAHQASYPTGTGGFSTGVKRPRHEAGHSPACSAEGNNARNCTSTAQYFFMAWCLI
jgi:hypothetical protein